MIEAIFELRNTEIVGSAAYFHCNSCLIKKVYFGHRIINLSLQEEKVLKSICKLILLKKLKLSEKLPRKVLYSRKSSLGAGILALRAIVDTLVLKLHVDYQRVESKVAKII